MSPIVGYILLEKRFPFQILKKILAFFPVSLFFIIWDIFATNQKHWFFNYSYTTGIKIANLPFEEVLFFFSAPLACIFILEGAKKYSKKTGQIIWLKKTFFLSLMILALILSVFKGRPYTNIVGLVFCLSIYLQNKYFSEIFQKYFFTVSLILTFIPFLIFNSVLTAVPIITYSETAISNLRFGTIPVEDFLYSYVLVSWCFLFSEKFNLKFNLKKFLSRKNNIK